MEVRVSPSRREAGSSLPTPPPPGAVTTGNGDWRRGRSLSHEGRGQFSYAHGHTITTSAPVLQPSKRLGQLSSLLAIKAPGAYLWELVVTLVADINTALGAFRAWTIILNQVSTHATYISTCPPVPSRPQSLTLSLMPRV